MNRPVVNRTSKATEVNFKKMRNKNKSSDNKSQFLSNPQTSPSTTNSEIEYYNTQDASYNHCHKSLHHTHPLSPIQCWKVQFV